MGVIFWVLVFSVPLLGIVYSAFTSFLKYRQHRAMLEVMKVYAERGDEPPEAVLTAFTKSMSAYEPPVSLSVDIESNPEKRGASGRKDAVHYWSLVGLFAVLCGGFAYAAYLAGNAGVPYTIVAFTMGAVAVWALVLAIAISKQKK